MSTPNKYKARHNCVGQYLDWKISNWYGTKTVNNWYEHHADPVVQGHNAITLWDIPVNTDRTIKANRPGIIAEDRKKGKCLLTDISVPTNKNFFKKFGKHSK